MLWVFPTPTQTIFERYEQSITHPRKLLSNLSILISLWLRGNPYGNFVDGGVLSQEHTINKEEFANQFSIPSF